MNRFCLLIVVAGILCGASFAGPLMIESDRELFVDQYLIDQMDNLSLSLGNPVHKDISIRFDAPWEGRYCGYITVFQDGDLYRMYYRGLPEAKKDGSNSEVTCYAESKDGISWVKPEFDLFEYDGSRKNNIVLANHAPYSHNFAPFLNTRPDAPAVEKYLAVAGTEKTGLSIFASEDGLQWRMLHEGVIHEGQFDSQNVAFWSDTEACYVCYFRTWSGGGYDGYRWVSRCTSSDLKTWSAPEVMTAGDAPPEHIYINQTLPYFRAPHIYIALAARFMPGRQVISPEQAAALGVESGYFKDCSDNVLMTSRGGTVYARTFMEGFVRPGIGLENWTSRTNYPARGIVSTGNDEMSFYIQHNYGQPTARLDRYTLRLDGFASVCAGYEGGSFTTVPLQFTGNALHINFSTSAAGFVRVALLDEKGMPLAGFSADECEEIIGDMIDRPVKWSGASDLSLLAEVPIRLKFIMKDADLFALQFR